MKNLIFILVAILLTVPILKAQSPQFAVVRPNGTTQIFPTWASAYDAAVNDDFIYLPGTGLTGTLTINKRLHIFGAGHHPDSTNATSKTILIGNININGGASGGSIQGISISSSINLGSDNTKLQNYLIQRCYIDVNILFGFSNIDSLPEYITVSENIISGINGQSAGSPMNIAFEKNIIKGTINNFKYCMFKNNVHLYYGTEFNYITNSILENNIFLYSDPIPYGYGNCFNSLFNNLKLISSNFSESQSCPITQQSGNIFVENIDDIFISYAPIWDYSDDFHLKPTCPGVGAGTDGTDVGIYGSTDPTSEGWVPSNPHIYFKAIDPTTGPDGKLHIEVGVRTNN